MITIIGRKLSIPSEDVLIGYSGDGGIESRTFEMPRSYNDIDLGDFDFKLDAEIANTKNVIDLSKVVAEDTITLTWAILESHMSQAGYMQIQIRAFSEDLEEKWHSEQKTVIIKASINASSAFPDPLPSEFTEMEARVTAMRNEADEDAQTASEQAGIATAKAEEASTSAENALSSEQAAKTSEDNAKESEDNAKESEDNAKESEDNALLTYNSIVTEESERVEAEEERVTAESGRDTAEGLRVTAESGRVTAESSRVTTESSRVTAEGLRVTAEEGRVTAEGLRVTAEEGRDTAEEGRVTAENAREETIADLEILIGDIDTILTEIVG
jgi:hypothetical protein